MYISCSICKEVMLSGNVLVNLNCGHIYHKQCIDEWIKQSKACPDCRKKVGKPKRVYPHFESLDPNDLRCCEMLRDTDDLTKKNEEYILKINQLAKELAEKDREIIANKILSQKMMDKFTGVQSLCQGKTDQIVNLNKNIVDLMSCIDTAESIIRIEQEIGVMANQTKNEAIRELHETRSQLKDLQKCAEFNDLALEMKKVQHENHMHALELSGRNKLIEALQRVNTNLESSQYSHEMENKRLKIQSQVMEETGSHRPKAKRRKLNLISENQKVIDLTDDDQPNTIDDTLKWPNRMCRDNLSPKVRATRY